MCSQKRVQETSGTMIHIPPIPPNPPDYSNATSTISRTATGDLELPPAQPTPPAPSFLSEHWPYLAWGVVIVVVLWLTSQIDPRPAPHIPQPHGNTASEHSRS